MNLIAKLFAKIHIPKRSSLLLPLFIGANAHFINPAIANSNRVGVWLTNTPSPLYYEATRIDRAVNELADAGFNTLYPNVWSRGTTFHRSKWAPMEPALATRSPDLDPICRMTAVAHKRGLQVIPWYEYGLMEPGDAAVVKQNPDWILKKIDGSPYYAMHGANLKTSPLKDLRVWLNPAHPGVRERFIGLITEIVERCKVDGVQLDDHFAWPVDLGYDAYTAVLYKQETGLEPPADYTNRAWMTWRRQKLTGLLVELRQALQRSNGNGRISLSPGPFRFAYNKWLQDWEIWSVRRLVDELVVQNYAYSVRGFEQDLNQPALDRARSWGIPINIGVLAGFGGRSTDTNTLRKKIALSAERGFGVIYFYWEGLWGQYAGKEGGEIRKTVLNQVHRSLYPDPFPNSNNLRTVR
ncbi:glycoside hydrolase family 10 protein [Synechococcus sp.]